MGCDFQADAFGKHSCQEGFTGRIDFLHVAEIDLHCALIPGFFPTMFEFGDVVRREGPREHEGGGVAVA